MGFSKVIRRKKIRYGIRKKIRGTAERPRLSVFRSNKAIYCQIINDVDGHTIVAASSLDTTVPKDINKTEQAKHVGKLIGQRAVDHNVSSVVFDRSGYLFHGRVKALAEGAREAGLKF